MSTIACRLLYIILYQIKTITILDQHLIVKSRIVKQRISFSGSQYGSCSTTYNTLPVKKVVYN